MFATWLKEAKNIEQSTIEDAEKLAGFYNEYNEVKRNELKALVEAKADKQDIEALRSSISDEQTKQFDKLKSIIETQGLVIQKMKDNEAQPSNATDPVAKGLADNLAKLVSLKNGGREGFSIKVAGSMSLAGNTTGQIPQAFRLPGFNDVPQREVRFLQLFSRGSISSNIVEWVYTANEDGTAGATEEGAAKKQIDFDLLLGSARVEKYSAYIKVTTEMLDDVPLMQSQINTQLSRKLLQSVEVGSFSGNGTTPSLNGVNNVATAWAAGSFVDTVESPNLVDVLRVGINQIAVALQPRPNYILLNPSDWTALLLVKETSTNRQYVNLLQQIASAQALDGIPIIQTTLIAPDNFLMGNTNLQYLLERDPVRLDVGLDGNDFTTNFRTILAEWRGVTFVQHNDRTAFVKGVISTAAAALLKPII